MLQLYAWRVKVESSRAFKNSLKCTVHQNATTNEVTLHEEYFQFTFKNKNLNTPRVGVKKKGGKDFSDRVNNWVGCKEYLDSSHM